MMGQENSGSSRGSAWNPARVIGIIAAAVLSVALLVLLARAALRLDTMGEDTFSYHIPFAALHAGVPLSFRMDDGMYQRYLGFPPLPEIVQGWLWRITGSLNAVGVINYFAFLLFLLFCHTQLRAPFWLAGMIALASPLVLFHMSIAYVDLFANAFLAMGICALAAIMLRIRKDDRRLLLWGLAGLIGAAWSKFQLVPLCALFFTAYGAWYVWTDRAARRRRAQRVLIVVVAVLIAALPYGKNLVKYGNPFWPVSIPFLENAFPYRENARLMTANIHPELATTSGFSRFFRSFLETENGAVPVRDRWTFDQGGPLLQRTTSFRLGGFWNVAVVVFNGMLFFLALRYDRRKGSLLIAASLALYMVIALLPQSYELRYYQCLPLCWGALIALLMPPAEGRDRLLVAALLTVCLALFLSNGVMNRQQYRVERISYLDAAKYYHFDRLWSLFVRGRTYCFPEARSEQLFFTGPTMTEYRIVIGEPCPEGGVRMPVTP